jgi:Peptidase of plants and bacteria
MVHVHQHNGRGTCHGGIVEGIADYCRLKCGFGSQNWSKSPPKDKTWKVGYETCGFFLQWLEEKGLQNFVVNLNDRLENCLWSEDLFKELAGDTIGNLWTEYLNGK